MLRTLSLLAFCTLLLGNTLAQDVQSNTEGLTVTLLPSYARWSSSYFDKLDELEPMGLGGGLRIGYGLNQRFEIFAHYDAHKFNFREDWDKYRLSALGGGVKVNFGGTLQALRPFVEVGVVNQRLVIDPVLFNGRLFEYLLRGLAVQANGGVQYFVSPQLALRGNVGFSAGKFSSFQLNRDGIEDRPDVKTFRVGVGVSYFFN
jgi:opacity protein-like surface antigen